MNAQIPSNPDRSQETARQFDLPLEALADGFQWKLRADDEARKLAWLVTLTLSATTRPPQTIGTLPDVVVEVGDVIAVETGNAFSGDHLQYALDEAPEGVAVDAGSGSVTISARARVSAAPIAVRASNPIGTAVQRFNLDVTVRERAVASRLAASTSFMTMLARRAPAGMVNAAGAVGENQRRYAHVANQRDALWLVWRGLAERNPGMLDDAVRAMQYGFGKQTPQGYFANGLGVAPTTAVGVDAFFLQGYLRIERLIGDSEFATIFATRFAEMNRGLSPALRWLRSNRDELHRQDRNATNRLFFDAIAFALGGQTAGDPDAMREGEAFAALGLANQRADGTYNEHGGFDSSYQGVSLLNLAGLLMHSPTLESQIASSLRSGAEWELGRIPGSGEIIADGNSRTGVGLEGDKEINYYEVAMAMLYAGHILVDSRHLLAAENIAGFIAGHR
jgi:hypothetical protein